MLAVVGAVAGQTFSAEEEAALEELRQAGLLEADIEELLAAEEEDVIYEYYDDGLDEAEERGGPRRRRRPGHSRVGRPRPSPLQALGSIFRRGLNRDRKKGRREALHLGVVIVTASNSFIIIP